jgi:hypothetical protein
MGTAFEISPHGFRAQGQPDLLGLWSEVMTPSQVESPVVASFGPAQDPLPVWRVEVGAQPRTAFRWLEVSQSRLSASQEEMAFMVPRVGRALEQSNEVVFDALGPEAELLAWVDAAGGSRAMSFSKGSAPDRFLERAAQDLDMFVRRLSPCWRPNAWVETRAGGELLARSILNSAAGITSIAAAGADQASAVHRQSVAFVSHSRIVLLQALAAASSGAAVVALRLAMPGGQLLALPAVWRFINRSISDLAAMKASRMQL